MSTITATVRERIQAQGFCGLNDKTSAQINYALRLSPAICMVWAAVGTGLASPTILWALVPFAALGGILPGHPFDIFYNFGLRHLFGTPMLPCYGARRRFACALAAIMLIAAAWGFQAGMPLVGYIAGWTMVASAFVNVSMGFCIPSFIVRIFFGKVACEGDRKLGPFENLGGRPSPRVKHFGCLSPQGEFPKCTEDDRARR